MSHSSWVRGLKHLRHLYLCRSDCRTLRECVDWNFTYHNYRRWICSRTLRECVDWNWEGRAACDMLAPSHSSWVRGLKRKWVTKEVLPTLSHSSWVRGLKLLVAPACTRLSQVALFVSAWIETWLDVHRFLKAYCRTLRECVDWNLSDAGFFIILPPSHSSWVRGLKHYK